MITDEIKNRKGAKKRSEVPPEVLKLLNTGQTSAKNLVESLVIDQKKLLKHTLEPEYKEYIKNIIPELNKLENATNIKYTKIISKKLSQNIQKNPNTQLETYINTHKADTLRSWGAFIIGYNETLSINEKLEKIKPFAADKSTNVRETACLAVKEDIINNLNKTIQILTRWTDNPDHNIRRFITESTRPRGVWVKHISKLKKNPELGLPLIEPLKSDQSTYVQKSVGNWLNDASKDNPKWVKKICKEWETKSPTKETQKICKIGQRTINNKKN